MKSLNALDANTASPAQWRPVPAGAPDPLGIELKTIFGRLTAGPMPDRMVQLADALEEAFRRGDLFDTDRIAPL